MKKILLLLMILTIVGFDSKKIDAFGTGEYFKFRIHYGFINAGYATLEIKEAIIKNKKVFHVIGKGYTVGMSRLFFKVDDLYESYIDKDNREPYRFIRKIDEGGYTKNQEGFFDLIDNSVLVKDYKHKTENKFSIPQNTQDILSSFYYLRNHPSIDSIKTGDLIVINMFFDNETTKFKLKFIGRENIKTKFGQVPTMIFKPMVQSGRVFKEQESVTIWVSDDNNRIPIRIKASLAVGSLKADLDEFKGLKNPSKLNLR